MTTAPLKNIPSKPIVVPAPIERPVVVPTPVSPKTQEATKPESIKLDSWKDWPKQPYSIFSDDFVHEKLAALKVNFKGRLGAASFKQSITADNKFSDEVKVWFNLHEDKSFYTKVTSKGDVRLQYDHGITTLANRKWNFYGYFKTSKDLTAVETGFGGRHISEHCDSDNKIKAKKEGGLKWSWMQKTIVHHNKLTFGLYSAFDITHRLLTNNAILLGYQVNDSTNVYLREENKEWRKNSFDYTDWKKYFDTYYLGLVRKVDDKTRLGLQIKFEPKAKLFNNAELVVERAIPQRKTVAKVKLQVGDEVNASAVVKTKANIWNEILSVSAGVHGENLAEKGRKFKYGVQFEFNV